MQTLIQNRGKPQMPADLVYERLVNQVPTNTVVLWDTSASTLRNKAASKAKGIVLALFEQAYTRRERIGLLEFSADEVRVVTPCQRVNRELITPSISKLTIGGNTPIDRAIIEAGTMLKLAQNNQPSTRSKLILITDGYFKVVPAKPNFEAEFMVIDVNQSIVTTSQCTSLAWLWGAQLIQARDLNGVS